MISRNLYRVLLGLSLFIFGMIACTEDDKINISRLEGKWNVVQDDPNIVVEGLVQYTFNAGNTCSIYSYDALSNRDTTIYRTYVISQANDLITLYDPEEAVYKEQYWIRKLTSQEMRWENASPKDGNPLKVKLIKANE